MTRWDFDVAGERRVKAQRLGGGAEGEGGWVGSAPAAAVEGEADDGDGDGLPVQEVSAKRQENGAGLDDRRRDVLLGTRLSPLGCPGRRRGLRASAQSN